MAIKTATGQPDLKAGDLHIKARKFMNATRSHWITLTLVGSLLHSGSPRARHGQANNGQVTLDGAGRELVCGHALGSGDIR